MTVGERRRAVAGPVPEPNISPTSCPDDIVLIYIGLMIAVCLSLSVLLVVIERREVYQTDRGPNPNRSNVQCSLSSLFIVDCGGDSGGELKGRACQDSSICLPNEYLYPQPSIRKIQISS